MKDKKYLINSVKEYILSCPFIDDLTSLGVDFLAEDSNSYSIEQQPVNPIVRKNIDSSSERQFVFVFATRFDYSEEKRQNIENSGFFEDFKEWVEENNSNEIYPLLKEDKTPTEVEVLTDAYLYNIAGPMNTARYQIQMKLTYEQKPKNGFFI